MFEYTKEFRNEIAAKSLKHFQLLPKNGKPRSTEWTVLATITKYNSIVNSLEIVALGTGSKCVGATKMSSDGDLLNDSHAEVICRRAFLRYLYSEIEQTLENKNEKNKIFVLNEYKQFVLNENVSFHFFTTHMPCGDAAIFPKQNSEQFGQLLLNDLDENCSSGKRLKIDENLFVTGGKCLDTESKPKLEINNHVFGVVRTKPGRGDPTLSISCSDKIARWTFVGIQGALLSILISKPIYLSSITITGDVPYSEQSLQRAIRIEHAIQLTKPYHHHTPKIGQADCEFQFSKHDSKQPGPSSIIWCKWQRTNIFQVGVEGRKLGTTKKNKNKGRLFVCKNELFRKFINIVSNHKELNKQDLINSSYMKVKDSAVKYNETWELVKRNVFQIWTNKDRNLLNFYIID